MLEIFTDKNFAENVLKSTLPVLVDFWAPWCGPCRIMAPIIEELAEEFKQKAKIGKLNIEENPEVATRFNILSIPTLLIFKDGKTIREMVGLHSKEDLINELRKIIK